MIRGFWTGALVLCGTLAVAGAGRAQGSLDELLGSVRELEKPRVGRRLSLTIVQRDSKARSGETTEETLERLRTTGSGRVTNTDLLTGASGWRRETSVSAGGTSPDTGRQVIVAWKQTQRTLIEITSSGQTMRQGILANATATTPADALLSGHLGDYLEGFAWIERVDGVKEVEFHLRRGGESLVVSAPKERGARFEHLRLDRSLPGQANGGRQVYEATIEYRGDEVRRVEELVATPAPYSAVAYREMTVDRSEPLAAEPEIEAFRFPTGTLVRDVRFRQPVEYEQGDKDPPEEEIRKLAEEAGTPPAQPGDSGASVSLPNEKGESVSLASFRGKVVVLYWFAQWSAVSGQAVAELERDFHKKYRGRNVQVIGIQIGASEDPAGAARTFRAQHALTFPILIDVPGSTLRQLGAGQGVPQVTVLDKSGKVRYSATGWDSGGLARALAAQTQPDDNTVVKPVQPGDRPKRGKH